MNQALLIVLLGAVLFALAVMLLVRTLWLRSERVTSGAERRAIDDFLAKKRVAFVGLSTNPKSFSRAVLADLVARGYDVVPVHPTADAIEGRRAYPRVQDIPVAPEAVLVMTPSATSADVVRDCVAAGVKRVWLHRGAGPGADSDEAATVARVHGVSLVRGQCPLMFLPDAARVHRAHAFFKKTAGTYPH